jgi:hypothetical protein
VPLLEVFIPGNLRNPLNGSWGGWPKHAKLAKQWRERTATRFLVQWIVAGRPPRTPTIPKVITFTAHVGRHWDDDNLPAAIKPIRDGLVDAGVIHSDAPDSGHTFTYAQCVDRNDRGVKITIHSISS